MPTDREREYYRMGFNDGLQSGLAKSSEGQIQARGGIIVPLRSKPKRKLSAWQKYIKNKRNHITYRDGKLNLKAMGVAYRRKKRR